MKAVEVPARFSSGGRESVPCGPGLAVPCERREALLAVLAGLSAGSPILAMPATREREVARAWWHQGWQLGFEGLMLNHEGGAYRAAARDWRKLRYDGPYALE